MGQQQQQHDLGGLQSFSFASTCKRQPAAPPPPPHNTPGQHTASAQRNGLHPLSLQGGSHTDFEGQAKSRKIETTISPARRADLVGRHCVFCGPSPARGLDRLDSSAPYGQGTIPCCAVSGPLGVYVPVLNVYLGCVYVWAERVAGRIQAFLRVCVGTANTPACKQAHFKGPLAQIRLSCRAGL